MTEIAATLGLALASALISALGAILSFRLGEGRVRRAASADGFDKAFGSLDLATIGNYLRSEFGSVALDKYSRDEKVRRSLDQTLARIGEFLETESGPVTDQNELVAVVPQVAVGSFAFELEARPDDPQSVLNALFELRQGRVWNALAKLRRDVEVDIREVFQESRPIPIHQVTKRMEMPPDAAAALRAFYQTASRAVHGEDVSFDEAVDAVENVRVFYRYLRARRDAEF